MDDVIGILTALSAVVVVVISLGALLLVITGAPLPAILQPKARTPRPAKAPSSAPPAALSDGRDQAKAIETTPVTSPGTGSKEPVETTPQTTTATTNTPVSTPTEPEPRDASQPRS